MAVFMRGSSFYLKSRHGGRQVLRSLKTADKTEAMARAARLLKALKSPVDTASDTNLFGEATVTPLMETLGSLHAVYLDRVARQVENGHLRPSYLADVRGIWGRHLSRFSGRIVDAQLNAKVIEYLDRLDLSVARRRKAHTLSRKLAALAGVVVKPHQFQSAIPPREKRPLTPLQLQAVKDACLAYPHPVAKLIYLAAVTGARIGEMMALGPDDLRSDHISITKTRCWRTAKVVAAKTLNSRRTVPVAPAVLDLVRPSTGHEYRGSAWFPAWRAIRKRAGIGKVGVHVLRHTWATQALAAGLPPKAVSLALGHASVSFTEVQYARFLTTGFFQAELAAFNR